MNIAFFIELSPAIGALIALLIGLSCMIGRPKNINALLILGGLFCIVQGSLYQLVTMLTSGGFVEGFNVGHLGYFGCYMFFIAYHSVLEKSIKNKPKSKKYLAPSVIAVAIFAVMLAWSLYPCGEYILFCLIINIPFLPLAFFSMRHLFCDISRFDKVNCLLKLVLYFFSLLRVALPFYGHETLAFICGIAVAVVLVLIGLSFVSQNSRKEVGEL